MNKFNCCRAAQRLLVTTALPLGLLAAGVTFAHAGTVTVTGAPGAPGANGSSGRILSPGSPGGVGGAAVATTTTPSEPSNAATAQGGAGGAGGKGGFACRSGVGGPMCFGSAGGAGGMGGAATATATTSVAAGSASAVATSSGGTGGVGGAAFLASGGAGGAGGAATATSSSASAGTGAVTSEATAYGGDGGGAGNPAGAPGGGGTASAAASAQNANGKAVTTASAPSGSRASARTNAAVGSGSASLVGIAAGRAVSNAVLTPGGADIGVGAMSAGYSRSSAAVQYEATAVFDFTTSTSETLDLNLLTDNFSGAGFDSLEFEVIVDGTAHVYKRSRLAGAESFFAADTLDLGTLAAGSQTIKLEYFLDYNSGTSAKPGAGFGFTYDLATASVAPAYADFAARPLTAGIPEPSTWAMMLIGFAGLACAGFWASRRGVSVAV